MMHFYNTTDICDFCKYCYNGPYYHHSTNSNISIYLCSTPILFHPIQNTVLIYLYYHSYSIDKYPTIFSNVEATVYITESFHRRSNEKVKLIFYANQ